MNTDTGKLIDAVREAIVAAQPWGQQILAEYQLRAWVMLGWCVVMLIASLVAIKKGHQQAAKAIAKGLHNDKAGLPIASGIVLVALGAIVLPIALIAASDFLGQAMSPMYSLLQSLR